MSLNKKNPWYIAGLHFGCQECGGCCAGPGEGYIWVTKPEIEIICDFLKMSADEIHRKYLNRVGLRTTIIEQSVTKDCIFLRKIDGRKKCVIYSVRPTQCRTWPFWSSNLESPNEWNRTAQKCPGINRGKFHSCEEIQKIKRLKSWWQETK